FFQYTTSYSKLQFSFIIPFLNFPFFLPSLHAALPIYSRPIAISRALYSTIGAEQVAAIDLVRDVGEFVRHPVGDDHVGFALEGGDRKSTRLNSSHVKNSYAVFCLKKKNQNFSYFLRYS